MIRKIVFLAWMILFVVSLFMFLVKPIAAQVDCVPRTIVVTIGDNSPGNPMQSFTTELGCVYNIFTSLEGYESVGTEVYFENVNYFPINGAITKVSGTGKIIGYQLTRLIHTQGLLYIIEFDNGKQLRLHPFEFEVNDL